MSQPDGAPGQATVATGLAGRRVYSRPLVILAVALFCATGWTALGLTGMKILAGHHARTLPARAR